MSYEETGVVSQVEAHAIDYSRMSLEQLLYLKTEITKRIEERVARDKRIGIKWIK